MRKLFFRVLLFSMVVACESDDTLTELRVTAENIIGTWQITEVADHNSTGPQKFRPATDAEISIFTFLTNSSFILEFNNQICSGSYTIITDQSELRINVSCENAGEVIAIYKVHSLTKTEMELIGTNADESSNFKMKRN